MPERPLTPAVQADRVLALFRDLEEQVDSARFGVLVRLGILIDLQRVEVVELVEAQEAQLPEVAVVNLAFFEEQFAADDEVAGDGVALELNPGDVEGLALFQYRRRRKRSCGRHRWRERARPRS